MSGSFSWVETTAVRLGLEVGAETWVLRKELPELVGYYWERTDAETSDYLKGFSLKSGSPVRWVLHREK